MMEVVPYTSGDRAALHALIRHPSLADEYERLLHNGELDDPPAHPKAWPDGTWIARVDGTPVGFATLLRLEAPRGRWAFLRIGVIAPLRRRGVGGALLDAVDERLRAEPETDRPFEIAASAWHPAGEAGPFLERRGFRHARWFWIMHRPHAPVAEPAWPDGVTVRPFDGSDEALRAWTACFNDAFADHWSSSIASDEESRLLTRQPHFRAAGLLLAWRHGRCVGFTRNSLYPGYGEVDVLGVAREARGLGLGRALLRWSVAWLEARPVERVILSVDGENVNASALYRSEGFVVERTREAWTRRPAM
jgi:mycothiol synthase